MGERLKGANKRKSMPYLEEEERDEGGEGFHIADKTKLKVKSLEANILVSVECAASISTRIITVRDEEL